MQLDFCDQYFEVKFKSHDFSKIISISYEIKFTFKNIDEWIISLVEKQKKFYIIFNLILEIHGLYILLKIEPDESYSKKTHSACSAN